MSTLRAVIYARVSSLAQKERDTIASQLSTLPMFIEGQGWKLVKPAKTYVDDGRSAKAGKLEKRTGFAQLVKDAKAGQFDVVAVVDLDRLTRSDDWIERGQIFGAFQQANIKIAVSSTGQVLDLREGMGDLFASLGGYFAAEENRKRSERTKRGKIKAAQNGRKPAGPTPFGYTYDKTKAKPWGVNEEQAAVVRRAFELVTQGYSCYRVSEQFNEEQISRPRGGLWVRERIFAIVTNKLYVGQYTVDRKRKLVIAVPRIVSDKEFANAQEALTHRRTYVDRTRHINLIESIAICGTCGGPMGITGNGRPKRRYYVCRDKKRQGVQLDRCSNRMQPVEDVDRRVWASIVDALGRPDRLDRAAAKHKRKVEDGETWAADAKEWRDKLERLERRHRSMLQRCQRGQISDEQMDGLIEDYRRQREVLVCNLELAQQQSEIGKRSNAEMEAIASLVSKLAKRLNSTSAEERQELVRLLVPGRDGCYVTVGPNKDIEIAAQLVPEPVFSLDVAG